MGELDGKVALITGSGSRHESGLCSGVRPGRGRELSPSTSPARRGRPRADLGDAVILIRCDVRNEAEVEASYAAAVAAFGRVEIACNVARRLYSGVIEACFDDIEQWEKDRGPDTPGRTS